MRAMLRLVAGLVGSSGCNLLKAAGVRHLPLAQDIRLPVGRVAAMRDFLAGGRLALLAFAISIHPPIAVHAQTVRCELEEAERGLIGTCDRVGEKVSEDVSRRQLLSQVWPEGPVRVTVDEVQAGGGTWSGMFFFDGWELPFTLEEDVAATGEQQTVLRTELAWVLISEGPYLRDDSPVLTFDARAYPLASDRDVQILETVLGRIDADWVWDRADDRDCQNDAPQASSLFCLMEASIQQHTGEYRHRQPALEVLRGVIREGWPERLSGHPVMDFNNHPDTTREDIRETLARALEAAASEAQGSR